MFSHEPVEQNRLDLEVFLPLCLAAIHFWELSRLLSVPSHQLKHSSSVEAISVVPVTVGDIPESTFARINPPNTVLASSVA